MPLNTNGIDPAGSNITILYVIITDYDNAFAVILKISMHDKNFDKALELNK